MTILRSGTTKKYSDNWATAFGKPKKEEAAKKSKAKTPKGSGKKSKTKKKSKK